MTSPLIAARTHLETLDALERAEAGEARDGDRQLLADWSGWGPLAPALDVNANGKLSRLAGQLAERHSVAEHNAAIQAASSAFYTGAHLTAAIWDIVTRLGFMGGTVLEPGCGNGRFIATAPTGTTFTGVERDPFTARIVRALYPTAHIINAELQDTVLHDDRFDLVVGNVPFGDVRVYHKDSTTRHPINYGTVLHNYFILRALGACRPGALVALITSRYTMDARGGSEPGYGYESRKQGYRHDMEALADFLGAIRLPSGAHRDAGTEVVSDIVVFRRRPEDEAPPYADESGWWSTERLGSNGSVYGTGPLVNAYFVKHPEMVVGTLDGSTGQYGNDDLKVICPPDEFAARLEVAVDGVIANAKDYGRTWTPPATLADWDDDTLAASDSRQGRFVFGDDGKVYRVEGDVNVPVTRGGDELRALMVLRDAALALLDLEKDPDRPDDEITPQRKATRDLYEAYVKRFGALNRATITTGPVDEDGVATVKRNRPRMGGFRADPDALTVFALEVYDDDTQSAGPAPILLGRINIRPAAPNQVDTPAEAVAVSIDRHGLIDLDTVGSLLGVTGEDTTAALRESGAAYEDSDTLTWVPANDYLSGLVRIKLDAATAAAKRHPKWERNVTALTAVIPEDLAPDDIRVRLGTPWVEDKHVAEFVEEILGLSVTIRHDLLTSSWEFDTWGVSPAAVTATYGVTQYFTPIRLVEIACGGGQPIAWDTVPGDCYGDRDKKVKNIDATLVAIAKTDLLNAAFVDWLWSDPDRCDYYLRKYNDQFNSTVKPTYDGSALTFPGMVTAFNPYGHQLDFVARLIANPRVVCGFAPGAGKTENIAMGMVKGKQLGLFNKPAAVVPTHLVEQAAVQFKTVFPLAKVLAASKDDLKAEKRKLFAAKIATGDWDMVVLPLSGFGLLPLHPDTQIAYLDSVIVSAREALLREGVKVKALGKMLDRLKARRSALLDMRHDDLVTFEQTGIDCLFIDEAHNFKNLETPTRMTGLSLSASKRAEDLAAKINYLAERNPTGHILSLWSGTIVSNSLLEVFVLMKYCQPGLLADLGISNFDAWAAQFVAWKSAAEVAPDGGSFRLQSRPCLVNVPELRRFLSLVLDVRDEEGLGLKRPERTDETVVVDPQPELIRFVEGLVERSENIRARKPAILTKANGETYEDMMLAVVLDGRKAALSLRLVGQRGTGPNKLAVAAERVAENYHATRDQRGVQLVFCDLGTPSKGEQAAYGWFLDHLIRHGVPRDKVAFIHDVDSVSARSALFEQVRKGDIAVLLGSTTKLGTGTNVQDRITHLHHLDAPWRPSDVQQRDGRGWRPGNLMGHVKVLRYVTERSFDAYMWQTLERKLRWIAQVLHCDGPDRTVDDISDAVLTFAEVKALATGQPLLLDMADAEGALAALRRAASEHTRMAKRLASDAARRRTWATERKVAAEGWRAIAESLKPDEHVINQFEGEPGEKLVEVLREVGKTKRDSRPFTIDGVRLRAVDGVLNERSAVVVETYGRPKASTISLIRFGPYDLGHLLPATVLRHVQEALAEAPSEVAESERLVERLGAEAAELEAAATQPFGQRLELMTAEARVKALAAEIEASMGESVPVAA